MSGQGAKTPSASSTSPLPEPSERSHGPETRSRKRQRLASLACSARADSGTFSTTRIVVPEPDGTNSRIYERTFQDDEERFGVKLIVPQHSESSYTESARVQNSVVSCDHRMFPPHRVPFVHSKTLGSSRFTQVDEVKPTTEVFLPGEVYARKVFVVSRHSSKSKSSTNLSRLDTARNLHHLHIVTTVMTYEEYIDSGNLHYGVIISPVANCTLHAFLSRVDSHQATTTLSDTIKGWLGCLASGLSYLHGKDMLHKDIKPSSIVVKDGKIFWTEFAISNHFAQFDMLIESASTEQKVWSNVFSAPEFDLHSYASEKTDIFSLGCVFLEMMTVAAGIPLSELENCGSLTCFRPYAKNLQRTIEWLCGLRTRLQLPFLQQFLPLCEKMIQMNPSLRPSAFEITKSIVNLEEVVTQKPASKDSCPCLKPWIGRDDENSLLVISSSKFTEVLKSNDIPRGSTFSIPVDQFLQTSDNTCAHCSEFCENFMEFVCHMFTKHLDKAIREQNLSCKFKECAERPAFQNEAEYQDHCFVFHGCGISYPVRTVARPTAEN